MAEARDLPPLTRCIELSRQATSQGENPFACVICHDGQVVAEATTRARRDADVTRHAEIIAISEAQRTLGTKNLSKCTLYSNVEPCAMCSFCIRETGIGRVVYSIPSPIMGGRSKWNILGDVDISNALPEMFRKPPEIVSGLMEAEAEQVWREWHPIDWAVLRHRGAIGNVPPSEPEGAGTLSRKRRIWNGLRSWIGRGRVKTPSAPG
jgi:tRNA(adenine34) deaminase